MNNNKKGSAMRRVLQWFAVTGAMLLLGACASDLPQLETAADAPAFPPFLLSPGDEIEVKFYYTPELNEQQIIRPDGKISMALLDDVVAAGITVDQLRDQLQKAYSTQLLKPQLEVLVKNLPSNRVYVGGEVTIQGAYPLVGPTTVSRAIFLAQGLKTTAYERQILLIRPSTEPGKPPSIHQVNMARLLDGQDGSNDVLLGPQDIVFVPRSPIANADLFVDQYIRQILPFSTNVGASYSYNHNSNPKNN